MAKIQVVCADNKVHYLGDSREIAKSIFNALCHHNIANIYWYETDEDTEIDLELGKEEEDEEDDE